jgi:hypothetical protein
MPLHFSSALDHYRGCPGSSLGGEFALECGEAFGISPTQALGIQGGLSGGLSSEAEETVEVSSASVFPSLVLGAPFIQVDGVPTIEPEAGVLLVSRSEHTVGQDYVVEVFRQIFRTHEFPQVASGRVLNRDPST